jgi:tRNA-2-methylthio-N6-dimethylallyladenosine synthase
METLVQINSSGDEKRGSAKEGRKKLFIRTFGCQMNEYDSAKIRKILESGYDSVDTPESADVVIVNTCSVRDKPEQKLYSYLGKMRELKQQNPKMLIGVGGCVAQQEGEKIVKRSRAVDFVFGTHNLSLVPSLIDKRTQGAPPQVAVNYRDEWEELPLGLSDGNRVSVFVSISRGCNKNCTYCIVPTTRGREVSRDPTEIERETRIAVHRGAREIVLLGQTVNSYGLDLEPRLKFSDLLNRLSQIEGLERIRFTSPHPQEVRRDFIDLVTSNPKICHHIHMPLQSGSNQILRAMNRNYKRERYLDIIAQLKERIPDMAITTDIIVGFPGETESDFQDTLEVMDIVQFDNSYSFMFSPRPGTEAADLEDDIPAEEKLLRLQTLQAKQDQITASRLAAWVGKRGEILIDQASQYDEQLFQGRLSQNILVNLEEVSEKATLGAILPIEVVSASRYTLKGRIIDR